jgi:anaerobic ribonucleoside-triphosphate reductase
MSINDKHHIICKCGEDLGILKNKKWYLCNKCEFAFLTKENAIEIKNGEVKLNIMDWLK